MVDCLPKYALFYNNHRLSLSVYRPVLCHCLALAERDDIGGDEEGPPQEAVCHGQFFCGASPRGRPML